MTISQAIEKAIEGGWNPYHWNEKEKKAVIEKWEYFSRIAFLDPLFWQSLGKAMDWKRGIDEETGEEIIVDPCDHYAQEVWLDNWHRFIDDLAEGKDAESFFANL